MPTYHRDGLTIVHHENDEMISVYRGREYLGSALPIYKNNLTTGAWTAAGHNKERQGFLTSDAAIDYLAT